MANNQITPFQLTDQFTMDNFNQRINETNTALQNNDPRNWALGITANSLKNEINRLSVADETISNGWYLVYLSDGGNIGGATQGTLSVDASSRGIVQKFNFYYAGYGGFCELTRIKPANKDWQPWEWVNPPMLLGVEYRTTERFRGKPVYTMAINTKAIGLGVVDDYPHGIANVDDIWVCGGSFIENGSNKYSIPFFGGASDHHVIASANRSVVHRINSSNVYVITDMIVILKYTKLTDD